MPGSQHCGPHDAIVMDMWAVLGAVSWYVESKILEQKFSLLAPHIFVPNTSLFLAAH